MAVSVEFNILQTTHAAGWSLKDIASFPRTNVTISQEPARSQRTLPTELNILGSVKRSCQLALLHSPTLKGSLALPTWAYHMVQYSIVRGSCAPWRWSFKILACAVVDAASYKLLGNYVFPCVCFLEAALTCIR